MKRQRTKDNFAIGLYKFKRVSVSCFQNRILCLLVVGLLVTACAAPAAPAVPSAAPAAAQPTAAQSAAPAQEPTPEPTQGFAPEEPAGTEYVAGVIPPNDLWPQPDLCAQGAIQFRPITYGDDVRDLGEYFEARGTYSNEKGQTFEIFLHTDDEESFNFYREGDTQLFVCIEAVSVEDEALHEKLMEFNSVDDGDWMVTRLRRLVAEQLGFLDEKLLQEFPESPLALLMSTGLSEEDAIEKARALIEDAWANDPPLTPSPQFEATTSAGDFVSPVLPYLNAEGLFMRFPPPDFRSMGEILLDEPSTLFVEIRPLDLDEIQMGEQPFVLYYAIDPVSSYEFDKKGSHYFTAHCVLSAYAQIYVSGVEAGGWMTLTFMAKNQGWSRSRGAGALSWSRSISGSSNVNQTYDAQVSAAGKGSYDIYGGWYTGSGGECQ